MATVPSVGPQWRSGTFFILSTVAIGQFTDLFLYGLVIPILPFFLRDRLHLETQSTQSKIDLLLVAFSAASVLFAVPAGWLADYVSSRQGPYLMALLALIIATALFAIANSFWLLVVSRILQGLSSAVVNAAGMVMAIDAVGPEILGSTLGVIHSFVAVGELGAPPLGGILYAKAGARGVFGVGATVIAIDFLMRILVIEKPEKRQSQNTHGRGQYHRSCHIPEPVAAESDALLPQETLERSDYDCPWQALPIIYCLHDTRLLTALFLTFVHALVVGTYDATLAIQVVTLFGFSSLEAGCLFLALGIPSLFIAPLAGLAIDRFGTRFVAMSGFGLLVPSLALLCVPEKLSTIIPYNASIALFCSILVLNGIAGSISSAPGIVEACTVLEELVRDDPRIFGHKGPYGQLFGLNWLVFNVGLTVGPLWGGGLRESIGYGNMYALLAGMAALAALASFMFLVPGDSRRGA